MSGHMYVYALTAEERSILDEHQRCYQCHCLYVTHCAKDCPEKGKALTLVEYNIQKLTNAFAEKAKAEYLKKGDTEKIKKEEPSITVAAVFGGSDSEEDSSDGGSKYVIPQHIFYFCLVLGPSIMPT